MEPRSESRRGGAEARLRAVLESLSEGVVAADATGRIVSWNRAALELFGLGREEDWLVDLPALASHFELFERSGEPVPLEDWPIAKLLRGEVQRDRVLEVRRRGLDGRKVVRFSGSRTHRRDGHDLAVVSLTDITEKVSLEEQVRQAQKLDSIGRLAGGVAHDFNNVLTVILSSAGAMQRDLAGTGRVDPGDVAEILDAGERARDLVRHLLAFARKQVLSPVVLELGELLLGTEKLLRRLIGADVALTVQVEAGLWPVHADPGAIEQAVLNLAVNARDAMPEGGRLAITARNVPVGPGLAGRRPGDWVEVAVTDSGVGMTAEVISHLFEPFFTTKDAGRGTGLGLATVHGTATQAGGYVRVESAPGAGSTFTLALPRCHGARGAETVVPADAAVVRSLEERPRRRRPVRARAAVPSGSSCSPSRPTR